VEETVMAIDPALFTVEGLLGDLLDDKHGNRDAWRKHATIEVGYMPPFPSPDTTPTCVVRFGKEFLRYSRGPRQGYFWDVVGDDFLRPSLALTALLQAPVPPSSLNEAVWNPLPEASIDAAQRELYEAYVRGDDEGVCVDDDCPLAEHTGPCPEKPTLEMWRAEAQRVRAAWTRTRIKLWEQLANVARLHKRP